MTDSLDHIAYIDDDIDILSIAQIALSTVGAFRASLIHGPQAALDQLVKADPDLVLLDVMMPGTDGPTLLQEIIRHPTLFKVPVVFMTARVQPKEVSHYLAMGAIGVIPKPFDPMTLASEVRDIWNVWHNSAGRIAAGARIH